MTTTHRLLLALIGAVLLSAMAIILTRPSSPAPPPGQSARPARAAAPPRPPMFAADDEAPIGNDKTIPTETLFQQVEEAMQVKGTRADDVLTLRLPREDVLIFVDGNEIPAAAGVHHEFIFHRCPCGTMLTHGHFLLMDFELNDVIDALRQDPEIKIVGTSPFLLGSDPPLTLLRFQAEGDAAHLGRTLRSAFRWIGEARSLPPQAGVEAP